jgi:hypothetical protein
MFRLDYPYDLELVAVLVALGLVYLIVSSVWKDPRSRPRLPRHASRGGRN